MGDIQREVVARLRVTEEGDAEVFGKTADEIKGMADATKTANTASESLGKTFEQATRAVETGSTRAAPQVEKLRVAIDSTRAAILEAQRAGSPVSERQFAELDRLEGEYEKLTGSVGKLRTAQQQAKRDIDDATEAAGGQAERINSLDDIVLKLAEDLGPGAVKWASWGAAAAGALAAGWQAGTKLREVMNSLSDGGFDRFIQSVTGLTEVTEQWVGANEDAAVTAQRLKNELNILAKNGIDVAGLSAEEAHRKFEIFTGGLRRNREASQEAEAEAKRLAAAFKLFSDGLKGLDLDKEAAQFVTFAKQFAEANATLSNAQLEAKLGPQLDRLIAKYKAIGEQVPPALQAMRDGFDRAAKDAEENVTKIIHSLDKLFSATKDPGNKVGDFGIGGVVEKAITDLDKLKKKAEETGEAIAKVSGKKLEDIGNEIHKGVEKAVIGLDTLIASLQKLNAIIDPVSANALKLRGELEGVFGGTPQIAGEGFGYDPLGVYKDD